MDLYILRHASAGSAKFPGKQDEKRALDDEGKEQCRDVGRLLARIGVAPDVFVSSPLTRAMQTAELVAKEIGYKADIAVHDALRPEASYEDFRQLLEEFPKAKSIVVSGHNPNLSEFLSLLISHDSVDDAIDLKKGAVAKVAWSDGTPRLSWYITPKIARSAM